jgi:hypothetical protein
MSQDLNSFARLQAAGVVSSSDAAESLRPVLESLSAAEVELLIGIGEKMTEASPEVEAHEDVTGINIF